jgi:hypothetical protein
VPVARWGTAIWGTDHWSPRPTPPGSNWGNTWRWWYQYGNETHPEWDLTRFVVEARWTTDSYTPGDGTFRGDLQPGRLELKLFGQLPVSIDMMGTIWARYTPTGATWCWFPSDFTSLLVAPGEPTPYLVLGADTWPARLTASAYNASRPRETITQRLNYIANILATDQGLYLPSFGAAVIEGDNGQVQATVQDSNGHWPPWLALIRDAATNGCTWLAATAGNNPGDAGTLVLHHARLASTTTRTLANVEVNDQTIWDAGMAMVRSFVTWTGTAYTGTVTTLNQTAPNWAQMGIQTFGPCRIIGDITASGAQYAAAVQMGTNVFNAMQWNHQIVDQIVCTSGDRTDRYGNPSTPWNPASMVWAPNEVLQWFRQNPQTADLYRVVQTSHVLNARVWEATHTLTAYVAGVNTP